MPPMQKSDPPYCSTRVNYVLAVGLGRSILVNVRMLRHVVFSLDSVFMTKKSENHSFISRCAIARTDLVNRGCEGPYV